MKDYDTIYEGMITEGKEISFVNKSEGTKSTVIKVPKGFMVTLFDTDALDTKEKGVVGKSIYKTEDKAIAYAKKMLVRNRSNYEH